MQRSPTYKVRHLGGVYIRIFWNRAYGNAAFQEKVTWRNTQTKSKSIKSNDKVSTDRQINTLLVNDNGCHRELDRERGKLEQQEKKIIADIKKMAKTGQMVRRLYYE